MNLRLVVSILLAGIGLTIVEGVLDINSTTLGRWYIPYFIVSTVILVALVIRATRPPRTPPAP